MNNKQTEWFGNIPTSWSKCRIGSLYKLRNTKVSDKKYVPLSVTKEGVLPQLSSVAKSNAHDDRKLIKVGDFAINSRSDRRGSCGISKYEGSVSLINTILEPREMMSPQYYDWLFHTIQFSDEFYKWGHGIVDDLWTTGWQDMKKIEIPCPPLKIQEKIANFIDSKCTEIDSLVADIQKEISILEEYKMSVIDEAVTKGIVPNIKMKKSGILWNEFYPSNWSIIKLKHITINSRKGTGITKEQVIKEGELPCVRYGEIYSKYDSVIKKCLSNTKTSFLSSIQYARKGDILFAATGELIEEIGKNVLLDVENECAIGGDIIIVTQNQNSSFINYALNSSYCQGQKSIGKAKLKVVHISASDILNIVLFLPPISEQNRIVSYLDDRCLQIKKVIKEKQSQLEILAEYKKSLIYEYVTGKKEVI